LGIGNWEIKEHRVAIEATTSTTSVGEEAANKERIGIG
jgi:hypothetical protein